MLKARDIEPRHSQIGVLMILVVGFLLSDNPILEAWSVLSILASMIALQFLCERFLPQDLLSKRTLLDEWESLMISALSVCLLIQTQSWILNFGISLVLVGTQILLRWRDKLWLHPVPFALGLVLLYGHSAGRVVMSSMFWPSSLMFWAGLLVLGVYGAWKTRRSDVVLSFLMSSWILFEGRAWILGHALSIDLSGMGLGGFLFVSLFLLVEPQSTPNSAVSRWLLGASVALMTYAFHFTPLRPFSLLAAMVLCGPLTPLFDIWIPGRAFRWTKYQLRMLQGKAQTQGTL